MTNMTVQVNELLLMHGIDQYGIIDFEDLSIINPRLLPDGPIRSAILVLLPYRTGRTCPKDKYNMGLFARLWDYHYVFKRIAQALIPDFEKLSGGKVYAFADHSPIDEKDGAAKCGLGFIGKNSLLINPVYGSYVFIGCFLFSERLSKKINRCEHSCGICNMCKSDCPSGALSEGRIDRTKCLSALSQKKKKSEAEKAELKKHRTVWGCDLCQIHCPYNERARSSTLTQFDKYAIENISSEIVLGMDEETYKKYAFSYREKEVLLENFLTVDSKCDIIN